MGVQEFEETLRRFVRAEPFLPFVVELNDGRTITVEQPKVIFDGGGALYLIERPLDMIEFVCEDTRAIRPFSREAVS